MRIEFKTLRHPSRVAKSLKRALAARGTEIGLRKCEEMFAKMCGYANWHELRKVCIQPNGGFVKDEEAGEALAAARRQQFAFKLSELAAVSLPLAQDVIDQIRPTGVRTKALVTEAPTLSPPVGP